jgi:DNA-binding transcriptional ArsR family regulator
VRALTRGLDAAVSSVYLSDRFINQLAKHKRPVSTDQLSATFAALADPTRREILARLAEGEATVNEIAAPFPITVQAISKHLKVLERAGLIARGRNAQLRPSRLRSDPLRQATDWLERYRDFWEGSLDRLAEHLESIQRHGPTTKETDDE